MRHLFLPACLCVMTWSNTAGVDAQIDKFSGAPNFDKKVLVRTAEADDDAVDELPVAEPNASADGAIDISVQDEAPVSETPSVEDTGVAIADVPSESIIELRPTLDPQTIPPAIDPQKIPLPPVAKPVVNRSRDEICETVSRAAQSNELPIAYFIRLLFQESGFDATSVSHAGAQGIAQFMPETAATEGLKNPFDPLQAIPASARLLRKLFDQFGNLGLAAAAYNAGPKRIQAWLAKKSKLPQETEGYVKIITGRTAETWRVASAGGTALTVPNRAPCKNVVPPPPPPQKPVIAAATKPAPQMAAAKVPAHKRGKVLIRIAAAEPTKKPAAKAPAAQRHKAKLPTVQLAAARKQQSKRTHVAQR
jgi:soluble lytic murein transglycosylase-like protein